MSDLSSNISFYLKTNHLLIYSIFNDYKYALSGNKPKILKSFLTAPVFGYPGQKPHPAMCWSSEFWSTNCCCPLVQPLWYCLTKQPLLTALSSEAMPQRCAVSMSVLGLLVENGRLWSLHGWPTAEVSGLVTSPWSGGTKFKFLECNWIYLKKTPLRLFFRIFMQVKTRQDLGNHLNVKKLTNVFKLESQASTCCEQFWELWTIPLSIKDEGWECKHFPVPCHCNPFTSTMLARS